MSSTYAQLLKLRFSDYEPELNGEEITVSLTITDGDMFKGINELYRTVLYRLPSEESFVLTHKVYSLKGKLVVKILILRVDK